MIFSCRFDDKGIKELWKSTFHDSEEYIDAFLEFARQNGFRFYGLYHAGRLISMLLALETQLSLNQNSFKAYYLYACATSEKYRGKGYFKKLFEFCLPEFYKSGAKMLLCVPQEKELFEYYKKLGFDTVLKRRLDRAENDGKKCSLVFKKARGQEDIQQALEIYRKNLSDSGLLYVQRDKRSFEAGVKLSDGELYLCGDGYFVYDGKKICEYMPRCDGYRIIKNAARFFGCDLDAYTAPEAYDGESVYQLRLEFDEVPEVEMAYDADNNEPRSVPYAALKIFDKLDTRIENGYANLLYD